MYIVLFFTFLCGVFSSMTPMIQSPANESIINPGDSFPFTYSSIAGSRTTSSFNFTVWMFTQPPSSGFAITENYAVGYYFGRYGAANPPANPYPPNPPPENLTMPNLATLGGGFGGWGGHVQNATFYLTVIEEYMAGNVSHPVHILPQQLSSSQGSLGFLMSLTYNHILYNVTT